MIRKKDLTAKYPFTKVETILGREEDLMWFTDDQGHKEFLHPLAVEGICIDGIIDYQFVQRGKDQFDILLELDEKGDSHRISIELDKLMNSILQKKKLLFVHFKIVPVEQIKPDPQTGKKALIVKMNLGGE